MCIELVEVGTEHAQVEQNRLIELYGLKYCLTQFFESGVENLVHWPCSKGDIDHFMCELLVNSEL